MSVYIFYLFIMSPSLLPARLWDGFILTYLLVVLTLASCTKERVAGRTGSTYEDMPITRLREGREERGQERCYGSLSNPAFEKRIHFCHTHFPSAGSAGLRHIQVDAHSGHLVKMSGFKKKERTRISNEVKYALSYRLCAQVYCFYTKARLWYFLFTVQTQQRSSHVFV